MNLRFDLQRFAGSLVNTSESQSVTYEAEGLDDDYSNIITNLEPDQNFYQRQMPVEPEATELDFNWLTESLKPPKRNAHLEMEDYTTSKVGALERRKNTVQFFQATGRVSDAQHKVAKKYNQQDEFPRQKELAFKQLARDIEFAIATGALSRLEAGSIPALTGGVPFFLQAETLAITADSSTNVLTSAEAHKLTTGDFVYFNKDKGAKLPSGIVAGREYYVNVLSATTFELYKTLELAVNAASAESAVSTPAKAEVVALGDAGTGGKFYILKNNIVDGNGADFTEDEINDVMEMCYKRGGDPTMAVMSAANKRRFSKIITGQAQKQRGQKERDVVNVTDTYISDFGTITAHVHRQYGNDRIDFIDPNYWALKYFNRPHEVSGLPKKGTYTEYVLEASIGVKGTQPKASGAIVNLPA